MDDTALISESIPEEHKPIYRLENELLKHPQVPMPVDHAFCNGVYARTIHIPAGTVLTGAVHRDESFFVVRKGETLVTTENGTIIAGAGFMTITRKNMKRALVTLTDVDITTFHPNPTNEKHPDKLWDMYTVPPPDNLLEQIQAKQIEEVSA